MNSAIKTNKGCVENWSVLKPPHSLMLVFNKVGLTQDSMCFLYIKFCLHLCLPRRILATSRSDLCNHNILHKQKQRRSTFTVAWGNTDNDWFSSEPDKVVCIICFSVIEITLDWLPYSRAIICQFSVWLRGVQRFSLWWRDLLFIDVAMRSCWPPYNMISYLEI